MDQRNGRPTSVYLSTKEAARLLNLSPRTLEAMRGTGRGPKCRRHGRVWRYFVDELEQWSKDGAEPAKRCG
jgi:excisionase family DNA binding protein